MEHTSTSTAADKSSRRLYGEVVKQTELLDKFHGAVEKSRIERFEEVLAKRCGSVHILLENLDDDSNGSACMRTAEAYGVQNLHVVTNPGKKSRGDTSMSANKWLSVHRYLSPWDAVRHLRERNFTFIAVVFDVDYLLPLEACSQADSVPLASLELDSMERVCFMFGSETRGLSQGLRQTAHYRVFIPVRGYVPYLNLSAQFAAVLCHLKTVNRLRADLEAEAAAELYVNWIVTAARKKSRKDSQLVREADRIIGEHRRKRNFCRINES